MCVYVRQAGGSALDCRIKSAVLNSAFNIVAGDMYDRMHGSSSTTAEPEPPNKHDAAGSSGGGGGVRAVVDDDQECSLAFAQVFPLLPTADPALAREYVWLTDRCVACCVR